MMDGTCAYCRGVPATIICSQCDVKYCSRWCQSKGVLRHFSSCVGAPGYRHADQLNKYTKLVAPRDKGCKRCIELTKLVKVARQSVTQLEKKLDVANVALSTNENERLLATKCAALEKQVHDQKSKIETTDKRVALVEKLNTQVEKLMEEKTKLQIEQRKANTEFRETTRTLEETMQKLADMEAAYRQQEETMKSILQAQENSSSGSNKEDEVLRLRNELAESRTHRDHDGRVASQLQRNLETKVAELEQSVKDLLLENRSLEQRLQVASTPEVSQVEGGGAFGLDRRPPPLNTQLGAPQGFEPIQIRETTPNGFAGQLGLDGNNTSWTPFNFLSSPPDQTIAGFVDRGPGSPFLQSLRDELPLAAGSSQGDHNLMPAAQLPPLVMPQNNSVPPPMSGLGGGLWGDEGKPVELQVHRDSIFSEGTGDDFLCTICQVSRQDAMLLPCLHRFCNGCITDWKGRGNTTCPTCRAQVTEVINEDDSNDVVPAASPDAAGSHDEQHAAAHAPAPESREDQQPNAQNEPDIGERNRSPSAGSGSRVESDTDAPGIEAQHADEPSPGDAQFGHVEFGVPDEDKYDNINTEYSNDITVSPTHAQVNHRDTVSEDSEVADQLQPQQRSGWASIVGRTSDTADGFQTVLRKREKAEPTAEQVEEEERRLMELFREYQNMNYVMPQGAVPYQGHPMWKVMMCRRVGNKTCSFNPKQCSFAHSDNDRRTVRQNLKEVLQKGLTLEDALEKTSRQKYPKAGQQPTNTGANGNPVHPLWKTELCVHHKTGKCRNKRSECSFAHGFSDLRTSSGAHVSGAKSELCKKYLRGACKLGSKCPMAHSSSEM